MTKTNLHTHIDQLCIITGVCAWIYVYVQVYVLLHQWEKNWARRSENDRKNMKRGWELRKLDRLYVRKRIRFPVWAQSAGLHCHNTSLLTTKTWWHASIAEGRALLPGGDSATLSSTSFLLYLLCWSFYVFPVAEDVLLVLLSPRTCECGRVHACLWEEWLVFFLLVKDLLKSLLLILFILYTLLCVNVSPVLLLFLISLLPFSPP